MWCGVVRCGVVCRGAVCVILDAKRAMMITRGDCYKPPLMNDKRMVCLEFKSLHCQS